MRSKEDLLACSFASAFNSDCTSGLIQDLDVFVDLRSLIAANICCRGIGNPKSLFSVESFGTSRPSNQLVA